jgi:hypothetical protein
MTQDLDRAHQSDICAYLSVILLLGLALNALLGWWWADQLPRYECWQSSSVRELPVCAAKAVRTRIFEMESGCPAPLPGQL